MRDYTELERLLAEDEGLWHTSGGDEWDVVDGALGPVAQCLDAPTARLICEMRSILPDLLQERRELRARCLESLAAQFDNERLTEAFDRVFGDEDSVGSRWCKKKAGGGVYGDHRVARLLLSWADGIRNGRIK